MTFLDLYIYIYIHTDIERGREIDILIHILLRILKFSMLTYVFGYLAGVGGPREIELSKMPVLIKIKTTSPPAPYYSTEHLPR